ncbi:hypothetical protein M0R72_10460 [Candidatus Pacearchaeota archaeon]|jgi:hypothetical protein|nr:hypothetical protein [Candidatus Pacearchaeota archaeon]
MDDQSSDNWNAWVDRVCDRQARRQARRLEQEAEVFLAIGFTTAELVIVLPEWNAEDLSNSFVTVRSGVPDNHQFHRQHSESAIPTFKQRLRMSLNSLLNGFRQLWRG